MRWVSFLFQNLSSLKIIFSSQQMANDTSEPLNYYTVFRHIQEIIPKGKIITILSGFPENLFVLDCIIVSEGANTMDIGRGILLNNLPRHRLDAGTFGTMGVGPGFAIAAAIYCRDFAPGKKVEYFFSYLPFKLTLFIFRSFALRVILLLAFPEWKSKLWSATSFQSSSSLLTTTEFTVDLTKKLLQKFRKLETLEKCKFCFAFL